MGTQIFRMKKEKPRGAGLLHFFYSKFRISIYRNSPARLVGVEVAWNVGRHESKG